MQIGTTVYNLEDIHYFMNHYHYGKSTIENLKRKIIAISEDKSKFAITTFNGRIENWYSFETGKSNSWDKSSAYVLEKQLVLDEYIRELEKFKIEQEEKDKNSIEMLEREIERIKAKGLPIHKFISKQEDYIRSLK